MFTQVLSFLAPLSLIGSMSLAPLPATAAEKAAAPSVGSSVAAVKKQSSGRLRVIVKGLPPGQRGKVVVQGPKGYRLVMHKSGTLRGLAPGRYIVVPRLVEASSRSYEAEGSAVKVKRGKTVRVRVLYRAQTAGAPQLPAQTPSQPETPPPPGAPDNPPKPSDPPDAERVVNLTSTLRPGEAVSVDTAAWLDSVQSIRGATSQGDLSWSVVDGILNVAASGATTATPRSVEIAVTGCKAGACDVALRIVLAVTVAPLQAPLGVPLTEMPAPSPDRIASAQPASGQDLFLIDELIIVVGTPDEPGGRDVADAVAASVNAVVTGGVEEAGIYQIRLARAANVDAVIKTLQADPRVYGVDRARIMADPIQRVATNSIGEFNKGDGWTWQLKQMRAESMWKVDTGAGVKVGIVDGFVVDDHSDLVVVSRSGPYKDMRPKRGDSNWRTHATHVAGLACAIANDEGVVGSSKGCPLVSDSGSRDAHGYSSASLLAAVGRVLAAGAKVVNISMGPSGSREQGRPCVTEKENAAAAADPADAMSFRALASGVLGRAAVFTVSAGNDCSSNSSSSYVANSDLDNVISVAAANSDGQLAVFSSWDAEVAAGGGFNKATGAGPYSTYPDQTYERMSGTSMAAPLVAGVAAAIRAKHPNMSAPAVGRCITNTAGSTGQVGLRDDDWPAGYNPSVSFTGVVPMVDALAAIHCKPSVVPPYHPKATGEWIARDPDSGRSLLVTARGVFAIADTALFNCLAQSRVVWDMENLRVLRRGTDGLQIGCSDSGHGKWDYLPDSQGGNTGANIILRNAAGNAWFINRQHEIQAIESAGVYQCLSESFPVVFNVPKDKISSWSPVGSKPADCKPAFAFAGSGGGDGWGVALSSSSVYNVFHHSYQFMVACHRQADASECWSPRTLTDSAGRGFTTSGHPGLYLDQGTGYLFAYATRGDGTAGVVCFDTADADGGGLCTDVENGVQGFTALTRVGEGGATSQPVVINDRLYAFNFVYGQDNSGTRNRLMCFDLTTFKACPSQPFVMESAKDTSQATNWPDPQMSAIGGRIVVHIATTTGDVLDCFDPSAKTRCKGTWPVPVTNYSNWYGAPYPVLDAVGQVKGLCLPTGSEQCFGMSGAPMSAPDGLVAAMGATSGWNGSGVIVDDRVYVPNGNDNSVGCYDFGEGKACDGFPKQLANAYLVYTVNLDPFRPSCLWTNADNGSAQIQSFDAFTGAECEGAPTA